jgi:hypothetical protein
MLEMREALASPKRPLALVACFPDNESLSDDILARLYRNQLVDVDLWQLVAERFGATNVEPRLRRDRMLGQRTLSWPDGRVPPLGASALFSEAILWPYVLREMVDTALDRRPDLADILEWRSDALKARALFALPPEMFSALRDWLKRVLDDTVDLIIDSNADPLVVGIALVAIRERPASREIAEWGLVRGRLEKFLGDRPLTGDFIAKYTAAAQSILATRAEKKPEDARGLIYAADDLLEKLGASRFASRSRWSALGARFLLDQLASNVINPKLLSEIEKSFLRTDRHTVDRLHMAARLTHWLTQPEHSFPTVAKYTQAWLDNESWVDDDLLSGSEQTTESWSLNRLSLLQAILAEAANANCIVVIVSDHGHIIEQGTTRLVENEASERWRIGLPNVFGEIAVSGPRVLVGKGDRCPHFGKRSLRSTIPQWVPRWPDASGVFGPVVVYSQSELGANWTQVPSDRPVWWDLEEVPAPSSKSRPPSGKLSGRPQATLFEDQRHWIDHLLESALFKDQIASTGGWMKPEQVEKLLRVLEAAPGQRILKQAFASQLQINAVRVSTNVAMLQRVLNLDGYPVLALDETTGYISLNQDLLKKQFDLK